MKTLIAVLLSMTLSVPSATVSTNMYNFEHKYHMETVLEYESGDGSNTYNTMATSTNTPSSYSSYMEAYFRGLTVNYGKNNHGTCGYVALGMLLSYYDSYLNDAIVPEQYDVNSTGASTNMIERNSSPGIFRDDLTDEGSVENYYNKILEMVDYSLYAKLITIGYGLGYFNGSVGEAGRTNEAKREEILNYYFNYVSPNNDYYIESAPQNSEYEIKLFIKEQIDQGYPVLVGVQNSKTSHAAICYSYTTRYDKNDPNVPEYDIVTDMTIYAHMGNNRGTHYSIENEYPIIHSAMVLKFDNMEHTHSYNYEVTNNGTTTKYCYCSSNILTVNNTEWTEFVEPENFDGNLIIPNWVTSIGKDVFKHNSKLKTVDFETNSNLNIIKDEAFRRCVNLTYIMIPNSVTRIGANAFEGCTSLETVILEDNSQLQQIGMYAFMSTAISMFKFPPSVIF